MIPVNDVSAMEDADRAMLAWLADRLMLSLGKDKENQEYLRRNDVTDESVWKNFRIGAADSDVIYEANPEQQKALERLGFLPRKGPGTLRHAGLLIPTYDPPRISAPVGFVKQSYGQNKHHFATDPRGLICSADINDHPKIVIADAPLLGFRLAQAGVKGVVVADDPAVLPPIKDWLASKEIVLTAYKNAKLETFRSVLAGMCVTATLAQVQPEIWKSFETSLAALGLQRAELYDPTPTPITPLILRDLVQFAQDRLKAGEGMDALEEFGADVPELVEAYGLGFLSEGFRSALSGDARRSLIGDRIANCIIVPAYDESGNVVDLLATHTKNKCRVHVGIKDPPEGLLAPAITTTFKDLIVTDSFRYAVRLFKDGCRNVLMLRGVEDAKNNAERMFRAGVLTVRILVRRDSQAIADALSAAGLAVEIGKAPRTIDDDGDPDVEIPSAPMPVLTESLKSVEEVAKVETEFPVKPELIKHDPKIEQATFRAGDATYSVEVNIDGETKLQVKLARAQGVHLDRFDLAVEAQRRRFATSAAIKTGVPFELIESHLIHILDKVPELQDALIHPLKVPTVIQMTAVERDEALTVLKKPDLLDLIANDLTSLGWVGEDKSKRLLYLIAVSRKLPSPLSGAMLASPGAGKSTSIEAIAAVTPGEDLIHVSRLTDSALYYHDKDALRHKLLVVDEADALTPEVLISLRILQTRGALTQSHVRRDPSTGTTATHFIEARGPIAVLTSTAGKLEEQVLSRCFEISVDESSEQTQRVLAVQRDRRSDPDYAGRNGRRERVVRLHQNIQRLVEPKPVLIPFAGRIQFPSSSLRHRREQERFLNLIEASALLHQFQRLRQKNAAGDDLIVADMRDYEIAAALIAESVSRSTDELSSNARAVLMLIQASKAERFSLDDLKTLKPDWTRYRFRDGLAELLRLEVVTSPQRGRGRVRQYQLQASALTSLVVPEVRLLSPEQLGELAKVGEQGIANFALTAATG